MTLLEVKDRLDGLKEKTSGEYLEFCWVRFIVNAMKCWRQLFTVVVDMLVCDVYMSTKVSGGNVMRNLEVSAERSEGLRRSGLKVLNPIDCGKIGCWSGEEYMWMWRKVLWIMKQRGCVLMVHSDDLKTSRGCNLELALAMEMGMDYIIINVNSEEV